MSPGNLPFARVTGRRRGPDGEEPAALWSREMASATERQIRSAPRTCSHGHDRWHVLQTRARQEKALSATLRAAGVPHFLPLIDRVRYHGGRRRIVREPLFSSYIFVWGANEAAYFAIETKRVVRSVPAQDQDRLAHEIEQIRRALAGGGELDPHAYLRRGRWVRVTAGPFQGLEGLVEDRPRPERLVLQIRTLGRAASLEIDADLLEPAD